ncbi:hypothetical protein PPL_06617 [Heterostelium album PN500]|uniref:Capsid protein n=1 Tax=Heterostelium pallidum (strain ATCC 26659 / Pp 5 / PN500) TaxID=670386 RepID=D3BF84_HETP5|nr:hypothetical protein PPL_06617 [Heterostelium album PN500]EFA79798.1 hypothetical protein PPL_06617 [Heterostelium album PN500]|eukprot:XP_020431919.1 hypothetical protein PPL_06617 [Heterostelium album PN500]
MSNNEMIKKRMSQSLDTSRFAGGNIKQAKDLYFNDIGGKKILTPHPDSNVIETSQHVRWQLDPVSFAPGTITNNPITFRLSPNYCFKIENVVLDMVLANTHATNSVTPVAGPYLIDRIDIGVNGDPNPVQTLTGDWLFSKFQFFSNDQVNVLGGLNGLGMSPLTFDPTAQHAIAALGKETISLPISLSLLNHINPQTINNDIIISVYPRANPVLSGTGTLVMNAMNLRLISKRNRIAEENHRKLELQFPKKIPYSTIQSSSWTGTLTAGTMTEIPIQFKDSCINAAFSQLGGPSTFQSEYDAIINVVDNNKTTILGSNGISAGHIRTTNAAIHSPGVLPSVKAIYWLFFADSPMQVIRDGINNGYFQFTSNQFLQLTTGSAFVTGTYTVDVTYVTYQHLMQEKAICDPYPGAS